MENETKMFLQANRRNFKTVLKRYQYCPKGVSCSQAIRNIKKDLSGRLIHFPTKDSIDLYLLLDLKMVQCNRCDGISYWRAYPRWERVYLSFNDRRALKKIEDGTYVPSQSTVGKEYDEWINRVNSLLKKGIIDVKTILPHPWRIS